MAQLAKEEDLDFSDRLMVFRFMQYEWKPKDPVMFAAVSRMRADRDDQWGSMWHSGASA